MIGSDRAQHLFPFSIQLNHELEICGLGRSLAKRIPEARGQRFNDVFGLLRWNDGFGAEALQKRIGRTCLISHESLKLTLRGEFVSLEPNGGWLFIGVPRIVTIADLSETGLSIGDFAAHDPIIDYLFLLQRNQTNLDEALRSAQALSKSQGRYRLLVEQSHDLICSVDEQGSVVFANRAWTYCLGDNSVNCGIASLLSPSSHGTWAECVDALRQNAKPQKVSLEFQAESGVRILADGILKKTVLEDEGVRIVGFLRDVTQQEEVRTALQK